ncbi:unnamed protein product [Chondrus crispus]|uniref:Uncharacterized protein n=1 Tax=Chondrus crispus TaxID=2769 RepID=R7QH64_CHOCR|nr:unnamed protein product [Chondrus crispus]CDF37083.1 unnamed protein product [Chondrus crispus]|eukprot:XP_005716902.1 unnamed protein product [Chondrus crispus]
MGAISCAEWVVLPKRYFHFALSLGRQLEQWDRDGRTAFNFVASRLSSGCWPLWPHSSPKCL